MEVTIEDAYETAVGIIGDLTVSTSYLRKRIDELEAEVVQKDEVIATLQGAIDRDQA